MYPINPPPGSIFHRARKVVLIGVEITADDVQSLRRGMSSVEAQRLIERHGSTIARTMLCHGMSSIVQILEEQTDVN